MSNIIKITPKEDPWQALKWTGENLEEINEFVKDPHIETSIRFDELFYRHTGSLMWHPINIGEYLFKSPTGQIGKLTQEILDRSWNVISEPPKTDDWVKSFDGMAKQEER